MVVTSANFSPSLVLTCRSPWGTSLLLPTSNNTLDPSLSVACNRYNNDQLHHIGLVLVTGIFQPQVAKYVQIKFMA